MGDNAFELRFHQLLGMHQVINMDNIRPYFPPFLDTPDIAKQLTPTKLNPYHMEEATTNRIMDMQVKNTHQ